MFYRYVRVRVRARVRACERERERERVQTERKEEKCMGVLPTLELETPSSNGTACLPS